MSTNYQPRMSKFKRTVRKFSVSTFVVFTFIVYAIHERLTGTQGVTSASAPAPAPQALQAQASPPVAPTATEGSVAVAVGATPAEPTTPPTEAPAPATQAQALGQYKDGDYTGTEVDAYYGLVQVQATIKQGKLADVQFLEYPNDRRTSIRINSTAIPYLQQEAIQAQSANVDIISGATLTSEAFVQSLQVALNSAKART
jgi:uncharacterized protein with FMN-binding domain